MTNRRPTPHAGSAAGGPLRVLIVEDTADDARLLELELRRGFAVTMLRVETAAALRQALLDGEWDLLVADHRLPAFTSLDALEVRNELRPDLPFFIVSGELPAAAAVEAMRAGADDFLDKNDLTRLLPAVRRELGATALRRQHAVTTAALEAAANGIMITDQAGVITWVNPACCQMTGYARDELVGASPRLLKSGQYDDAFYRELWQTIIAGKVWDGELVNRRKDGTRYTERCTITPVPGPDPRRRHVIAVCEDITEHKRLQQELYRSQRMDSIGRLAGGIAHDFNNLLQAIIGFTDLLLEDLPPSDPRLADVREIHSAGEKATALTRQLLAFSRQQVLSPRLQQLNGMVQNVAAMMRRLLGEDIRLETRLAADVWPVRVDAGQIEQVLLNMAINARDAMPAGGRIELATENRHLERAEECRGLGPEARPGDFVVVRVADTGVGMSPETLQNIFEPFFTTKENGKGTGLGLSVAYGIVRQHNGWIQVSSAAGTGSVFAVWLPASPDAAVVSAPMPPAAGTHTVWGRGEIILVLEDEDRVRHLVMRVLAEHGFSVLGAASLAEARTRLAAAGADIRLLFSDAVLPDGNGVDLAAEYAVRFPAMQIIITSGHMEERTRWPVIREKGWPFLAKPYSLPELLRAVGKALGLPVAGGEA